MARIPGAWLIALRMTGLGWYVAACVVIGVAGGFWIDKLLGTTPLFIILGTILGSATAFWGLYKMVQPLLKSAKGGGVSGQTQESHHPGRDC